VLTLSFATSPLYTQLARHSAPAPANRGDGMFSLAVVAMIILFFGILGGLIAIALLKITIKGPILRMSINIFIFLLALFSLLMAFSIVISSVAIAIRLLGAAGIGSALYALLKLFKGEQNRRR